MIRKTMKMLLVALIASFAFSTMAEAAPKKVVRHRTKHSSRVSSGTAAPAAVKKQTRKKKRTALAVKKPTATRTAKRKPTTKPR